MAASARRTLGLRSIRARILAAFVLSLVALTGALGYGIGQLQAVGREIEAVNTGFLPMAEVGVELHAIVRQLDRDHDRFARDSPRPLAGRRASAAMYRAGLHDSVARGRVRAHNARRVLVDPDDLGAIDAVLETLDEIELQSTAYEEAVNTWLVAQESSEPATTAGHLADLDRRAKRWARAVGPKARVVDGLSTIGGGSLPGEEIPSRVLAIEGQGQELEAMAQCLRQGSPPLVARIERQRLILDPRTVLPGQDAALVEALRTAVGV